MIIKVKDEQHLEKIYLLSSNLEVSSANLKSDLNYIGIKDNVIHYSGVYKLIFDSKESARAKLVEIANSFDSTIFEDGTIEGFYEIVNNELSSNLIIVEGGIELDYAITKDLNVSRVENVFNFGDLIKLVAVNYEFADIFENEVYPRPLTPTSNFLAGNYKSKTIDKTVQPTTTIIKQSFDFDLTEVDGGSF